MSGAAEDNVFNSHNSPVAFDTIIIIFALQVKKLGPGNTTKTLACLTKNIAISSNH